MRNYDYLKIQKKIRFEKLDVNNKIAIVKAIIEKYRPDKIFYFAGQSSLTKSIKDKKKTFSSHFNGSIEFSKCNQGRKIKEQNFLKLILGIFFHPNKGYIDLNCKFASSNNPYILAQQKTFKLIQRI